MASLSFPWAARSALDRLVDHVRALRLQLVGIVLASHHHYRRGELIDELMLAEFGVCDQGVHAVLHN